MAAQSSSPADKVASVDDLLTDILFRLPVRCLLRFKSVSKHWYFIITSPSFKLLRSRNPDPPLGLFVPTGKNKPYPEYELVSFDIKNPVKAYFRTPNFDPNAWRIGIEHSCNGLLLFSSYIYNNGFVHPDKYYVYNPTTNQFITLPMLYNYYNPVVQSCSIAFDPSKSSDYRVIYVCGVRKYYYSAEIAYEIKIFSSTTRTWKSSCQLTGYRTFDLDFKDGVYWNNAIHWMQPKGYILYLNLNLDEESIHEKVIPISILGLGAYLNRIFESQDQLLLVEHERLSPNSTLKIYELKRDYSSWSVKYHVDMKESFLEVRHAQILTKCEITVISLVLGEKEDDSFLVIEFSGKALRFNFLTKTFHKLYDFHEIDFCGRIVSTELQDSFQFRESLYSF